MSNGQCKWCDDPALGISEICQRCRKILDKRPDIAATIVAGYFNGYLAVSDDQVKRAVEMADVLLKELCRMKP